MQAGAGQAMSGQSQEASGIEVCALAEGEAVQVDGVLDEAVWQRANGYAMTYSKDNLENGEAVQEGADVWLAYDKTHLYIAARLVDSDIVQEAEEDQKKHFATGDVFEVFLKPVNQTWYWELYATPNDLKSAFFFPGGGRFALPSAYDYDSQIRAAGKINGTLNNWRDVDEGWTAEMAIPLAELAEVGEPFDAEHPWSLMVGRYNYSRYLDKLELSMYPALSITRFHNVHEYAPLILSAPDEESAE